MKIALVTNLIDGKGLFRDSKILKKLLESWGHAVTEVDFRRFEPGPNQLPRDHWFTVCISLEVVVPRALSWSDKHILVANPDWMTKERLSWLDAFRVVIAKTRAGEAALKEAKVKRVVYTGFESEDRMLEGVPRERVFMHTFGQSIVKGTRTVLRAWDMMPSPLPSDFMVGSKVPEEDYKRRQNRCQFWMQPSAVEGYGHIIHEGLSCGALVATLDAAPMNESAGLAARIPCRKVSRQNLADVYEARPEAVKEAAERLWAMSPEEVGRARAHARASYIEEREEFRQRFRAVLEEGL